MLTVRADNSKGGLGLDIGLCLGKLRRLPKPKSPFTQITHFYNWFLVIKKIKMHQDARCHGIISPSFLQSKEISKFSSLWLGLQIPNHHHVISLTMIIIESKNHCRIWAGACINLWELVNGVRWPPAIVKIIIIKAFYSFF